MIVESTNIVPLSSFPIPLLRYLQDSNLVGRMGPILGTRDAGFGGTMPLRMTALAKLLLER